MGHRKHSAPRRGSLAYLPRARAKSIESRIRTWPEIDAKEPRLLGFAGFKAANIHLISIDDRERTPNFGKPLMSRATVIVTPPMRVIGIRAYEKSVYGLRSLFDIYADGLPKELARKVKIKPTEQSSLNDIKLDGVHEVRAIVAVTPRAAGLEQKKPFVFEVGVGGGKDVKARFEYLKNLLGKDVRINEVFKTGEYVDVSAITKGKGFEGPVTRWGIKRKQHKSRKSVRAVGTLGPISPATVMYTVPRAGQRGFHQRLEYNKRILMIASVDEQNITPKGGFMHFGIFKGDYIVVRGSIAGAIKRLVKLRYAIRPKVKKVVEPKIVEVIA
ncbi:50S ribosomal protein L3 [archaeon HR05]|nr:50S ribosomal protein L3 [archaeon HR05]